MQHKNVLYQGNWWVDHGYRAEHGCTCRLPGSLPTGIFLEKIIPGPVKILSHGSPGPTGNLPVENCYS